MTSRNPMEKLKRRDSASRKKEVKEAMNGFSTFMESVLRQCNNNSRNANARAAKLVLNR